jgi:integrase
MAESISSGRDEDCASRLSRIGQRSMRRVFGEAKVTGNAHMFRHTFATDLLTKGVPIEDVAILLGHATPVITAKYYAHFVKARRERLEERVRELWS